MGICRTIPIEYRYAPKYLNGLGLPDLYALQGIEKIKAIVNQIHSGTKLGATMMAQLEACNIELGIGAHMMEIPFD